MKNLKKSIATILVTTLVTSYIGSIGAFAGDYPFYPSEDDIWSNYGVAIPPKKGDSQSPGYESLVDSDIDEFSPDKSQKECLELLVKLTSCKNRESEYNEVCFLLAQKLQEVIDKDLLMKQLIIPSSLNSAIQDIFSSPNSINNLLDALIYYSHVCKALYDPNNVNLPIEMSEKLKTCKELFERFFKRLSLDWVLNLSSQYQSLGPQF